MFEIRERPPTLAESRLIATRAQPSWASYGCITLLLGVVPVFVLREVLAWAARKTAPQLLPLTPLISFAVAALLWGIAVIDFYRSERVFRSRGAKDLHHGKVQEFHVSGVSAAAELNSDTDPVISISIGDGKSLILAGQWLRDASTYGAPSPIGDPDESIFNGFPEPYSFPSSAFVVTRLAHSGAVFGIEVRGDYVRPDSLAAILPEDLQGYDSLLLDTSQIEVLESGPDGSAQPL